MDRFPGAVADIGGGVHGVEELKAPHILWSDLEVDIDGEAHSVEEVEAPHISWSDVGLADLSVHYAQLTISIWELPT